MLRWLRCRRTFGCRWCCATSPTSTTPRSRPSSTCPSARSRAASRAAAGCWPPQFPRANGNHADASERPTPAHDTTNDDSMTDTTPNAEPNPQHELASAYLDGVASPAERAEVEASPELQALVASFAAVRAHVADVPASAADSARGGVCRRLRRVRCAGRRTSGRRCRHPPVEASRRWARPVMSSAAAVLLVGVIGVAAKRRHVRQRLRELQHGHQREGRRRRPGDRVADVRRHDGCDGHRIDHRLDRSAVRRLPSSSRLPSSCSPSHHPRSATPPMVASDDDSSADQPRPPTPTPAPCHRRWKSRAYAREALAASPRSRCSWPTFSTRASSPLRLAIRSPA